MKIFAISDLHLSINSDKPMDIFGPVWEGYLDTIENDWRRLVSDEDIVLLSGDFSWAMRLEDAVPDMEYIARLPGKKIIIKGNHDYWWNAIGKVRSVLPPSFIALQNDAIKIGKYIFCGTRGWAMNDEKMLNRETLRLKMSLDNAKALQTNGEDIICMMHYPPFEKGRLSSPYTRLFEEYGVKCVVYGHLHGKQYVSHPLEITINDITYYLTSCDLRHNHLTEIIV